VEFCPNCGSRLVPKKPCISNEGSVVLACPKCGYVKQGSGKSVVLKVGKIIQRKTQQSVTVISEADQKMRTLPTIKVECPKCGNHLVYVWQVQTRGGDEASTQFMRCTKCSHTFREYS
jgi:DNA-directed RNA polymerase subunit M